MIILNQDKLKLQYHTEDNLVFEINTNLKLEILLDKLRKGEDISSLANINAYYISHTGENISSNELNNEFIRTIYSVYQQRKNNSFIPDYNVVHDEEYEGDESNGDEYHAELFPPNTVQPFRVAQFNKLSKDYQDLLFNVDTKAKIYPLSFNNIALIDALKTQIACTLDIMPHLLDLYPEASINELKKISDIGKLTYDTGIYDFYAKDYPEMLPNKETLDILLKLTPSERQLLDCEMNSTKVTDLCKKLKKSNPDVYLTRDIIEKFFYQHLDDNSIILDKFTTIDEISTWVTVRDKVIDLFTNSKYKRPPRVIDDYVSAQLEKGKNRPYTNKITANEIFNNFNLGSLTKVAKTKTEILYSLCDEFNFNEIKQSHMDIIATLYPKNLISYLSTNNFIEYYKKYQNMSDNELKELLIKYRDVYKYAMEIKESIESGRQHYAHTDDYDMNKVKFDLSKSPIEQIKKLNNYKADQDRESYERKYNYKFSNNDLAIKGRNIEIIDKNFHMYTLQANDLRNYTIGYDTNCCQHWGSAGESCVTKLTTDPYAGAVVIEKNGKIIAQGFVWTDESQDTIVFDNVEFNNDRDVHLFNNIFSAWAKECPYKNVHIGTSYNEQMQGWGASIPRDKLAQMPTTINNNYVYSDYVGHSNARTIKKDGRVVLPEAKNYQKIEHELIPSRFDMINQLNLGYLLKLGISVDKVIELGEKIDNQTLTDSEIKNLITHTNGHKILLDKLDTLSPNLQVWFAEKYPNEIEYLKNPCEEIAILQVRKNPLMIKNIQNPSNELQIAVVQTNGLLFSEINNPTEACALAAVRQNGYALALIPPELQTNEVISTAILTAPRIVLSLQNPTYDVIEISVRNEPQLIGLIEQKIIIPEYIQEIAVRKDASSVLSLRNPSENIVKLAVEQNGMLIRNYQRKYPQLKEIAIRQNPLCIGAINNPTREDCELALTLNQNCLSKIKNQSLAIEVLTHMNEHSNENDYDIDLEDSLL